MLKRITAEHIKRCFTLSNTVKSFLIYTKVKTNFFDVKSQSGNTLWLLFGGLGFAFSMAIAGLLWCITVVGIPFGLQCFKLAELALAPFGAKVD